MQKFNYFTLFLLLFSATSCGLFNKNKVSESGKYNTKAINTVVKTARSYVGTPYKFGGMDEDGLDCSGLVNLAFQSARLVLPRVSADMAEVGREVKMREVRVGDLVFFITNNGTRINHVGIVTERKSAENVQFIHAASSGVKEDNLYSKYYQNTFVKATRPF
ncbi:MAG: C40 family peptidase [Saprospiraceae bacterium]|nr:C40 family peptidase [Saprospiraceae bacterium]